MLKNILLLLVLSGFISSVTACSSNKEKEEDPAVAEEVSGELAEGGGVAGDEFGDGEVDDFGESSGDSFAEGGTSESAPSEEVSEAADDFGDDFGDGGTVDGDVAETMDEPMAEPMEATEPMDTAMDDSGFASEAPMEEPMMAEPMSEEPLMAEEAPTAEPMMEESYGEQASDMAMDETQKSWIPVKKIKDVPYRRAGVLVNAVYLARPGDDVTGVSQKIFGSDKSEELLSINPWLSRGIKTGDKIYYHSPQRPNDDSRILTFYEDAGLQPEIYVTKEGDNIRQVASQLLGDKDSWKELWATNPDVESKGVVEGGISLRYWADSSVSTPPPMMAENDAPAPPPMDDVPPPPSTDDIPPPMPSGDSMSMADAGNEPPPPPSMNEPAPPPPPPVASTMEPPSPPPPPPAPPKSRRSSPNATAAGSDDGGILGNKDQVMFLGVGVILLLLAVVLIIIIRRKKAQRTDMDFSTATHTHIE
ncbi:MAG: hypothetical protein H6626_11400 [Pseudobdellovibrionaceae bacterium]|nr:hypothetical protein [Bdellovibrionales bacterium]USN46801.1 MAG: hypothetical protein H6626_11400 [Pseudobdellovibrionaceae bacterium]